MKTIYLSLAMLFYGTIVSSQTTNFFNNNGGDFLWSNTANWSQNAVPNTTNTSEVRLNAGVESLVDVDVTIPRIQNLFGTNVDEAIAGTNTLTIDTNSNSLYGIENTSNNDVDLIFRGKITINNSIATGAKGTYMRNTNGNTNDVNGIIFDTGSVLTLTTFLEARAGTGGSTFYFNGTLAGAERLRFFDSATAIFGNSASNAAYTGDIVQFTNSSIVVNTTDDVVFYSGSRIQINGTNASITLNGANVFQSGLSLADGFTYDFNVNENQNSMTNILFAGAGTINMAVDNAVTNLTFADNSENNWGTGILNITGFKEGVIKFGTDNTGLTPAQLSQITADGVGSGQTLALDTDGTLVLAATLSIEDYNYETKGRLSFPTVITNENLQIKEPITSYKIFNISGQKIQSVTSKNEFQEINTSNLEAGIYILTIEEKVSERFIKK